ncbi:MAG: pimeloyl-ACP methyl ester carboxylesterase [Enterobacterales bacterium]|jgi:pimeloyl-ACP methyl ester carboxylesterase
MTLFLKTLKWLLLLTVVMLATFITLHWAPDRSVEELKIKWAQAPSVFIEIDGMQVHLRDEGPRDDLTPIVLLHGTSASLHTWDGWVNALKDERRVIRFDMPAFGLTGPSLDNDYSIESYSQFVVDVLKKLQVEHYILAGNSLGGYVAWATAVLHPNQVKQLILIDSSGYPTKAQSVPIAFKIATIPILNTLMEYVLPRSIVENSLNNLYGDPSGVTPELIDRYYDLNTRAGNRQALVERFNQTQAGTLANKVSKINIPTLIIWGGQDNLIPKHNGERFHKEILGSKLVLFNELGHIPQEEDPVSTVAALKLFLSNKN